MIIKKHELYIKTAFATMLELTSCVECAHGNLMERLHRIAGRKSLEISLLYGPEWGEDEEPVTSPDGTSNYCLICASLETHVKRATKTKKTPSTN